MSNTGPKPDVPSSSTPFTISNHEDECFPRGSLRQSVSARAMDSLTQMHSPSAQSAILENEMGGDFDPSDTCPPTPRDPFLTPTPSNYNLSQLVGSTASRLSIHSPVYNFSDLANGQGAGPIPASRKGKSSSADTEITTLTRVSTEPGTLANSNAAVPPVPALPSFVNRHSRSVVGVVDLAAATNGAAQTGKRESFAAPPPMMRPPSSGMISQGAIRRTSQRPGTTGTVGTIVSTGLDTPTYLSPPGSAHSLSEKSGIPGVTFQLGGNDRKGSNEFSSKRISSSMLDPADNIEKPWLKTPNARARFAYFLTYSIMLIGVIGSFLRIFFGAKDAQLLKGNLCLVMDDEFNGNQIDSTKWGWEVQMDGFGNGEFEMTTNSRNNSFIEDGVLYIVPTLTSDVIGSAAVIDGFTYNITGCTSLNASACGAVSNLTTRTVINPVQSARLTTINSSSIQFGRVEIRARNPSGDWIWPALWMLPVNNTYGPWPLSGEIDIMEARGNGKSYPAQGSDYVRASLNWGPLTWLNEVSKTFGWWRNRRSSYDADFHVYSLEWSDKFIRAYVDTRLHFMLDLSFNKPFFDRGDFPPTVFNGSQEIAVPNPWGESDFAAPFDQPFYLIMDVAVGGTNGWFPDNTGNKPWLDGSTTAMYDFARSQDTWYATWPTDVRQRALAVDYVKMWQLC
ncbi:hypothetical protein EW145_g573 [Phellinidium pouzarii]|uniref:GH16 domain-containing protein n=1 Tax=Phellinidium pouzarii TaxID=167371 RepID=A0A4S4LHP6_9AGAM|nr:hypothetical protein EW145_g573 [Phellinidium pouzarii]